MFDTTENLNEKTPNRPRKIIKNAGVEVILSVSKKPVYTDTLRIQELNIEEVDKLKNQISLLRKRISGRTSPQQILEKS